MASVRRQVCINTPAEQVWDALRDVGALHTRLVRGFVTDCRLEGDIRFVTFANGATARELIVDVDDRQQRVVWSATGGRLSHHNASAQVKSVAPGSCEVVWVADLQPNELAPVMAAMIEQGLSAMKQTLETRGAAPCDIGDGSLISSHEADRFPPEYKEVLSFWFTEIEPARWWKADPAFDAALRHRFDELHHAANLGELWSWRSHPRGRLAEIIVLDQFSRNMYRGTPRAFASDSMALALAQEAVAGAHDAMLPPEERVFVYMPYQHSESRSVHVEAERLFGALALADHHDYELRHKAIIDRFGRYPHRNAALGRESSPEEAQFLTQPGSRF